MSRSELRSLLFGVALVVAAVAAYFVGQALTRPDPTEVVCQDIGDYWRCPDPEVQP